MFTQPPQRHNSTLPAQRPNHQQHLANRKGISLARFENQSEALGESLNGQLEAASNHHWRPPFMPWFETDFQGSLRVRRLHRVARWIYGDLLRASWHCDTAPCLPNDDDELRAICDCPPDLWKKHAPAVRRCFTPTPDGKLLFHPKVLREYERALSEHQRKVAAGKSRWNKPIAEGCGPQFHNHEHKEVHFHEHMPRPAKANRRKLAQSVSDDE